MLDFIRKTALWIVALPLLFVFLGVASNQAVLVANHDRFPVMINDAKINVYKLKLTEAVETSEDSEEAQVALALLEHGYLDDTHVIMTPETHLNFLADWIDLKNETDSPGDLAIDLGEYGRTYSSLIWAIVAIGRLRKRED